LKYRYFIQLSFKGTNYHGWQLQPNGISVQGVLNKVLSIKLKENIEVIGVGRTDTGVHAKFFVAHFDSEKNIISESIVHSINSFLPDDISLKNIFPVKPSAHSRFSAISRTYKYYINNVKNSFSKEFSYYYHRKLDVVKMNEASETLLRYSDFTSFCKSKSDTRTNLCKIYHAGWNEEDGNIVFTIKANRFLRNMVRSIVGTLIEVGSGKITIDKFTEIIEKKNRIYAGMSVPAHGLYLFDIEYPIEIF